MDGLDIERRLTNAWIFAERWMKLGWWMIPGCLQAGVKVQKQTTNAENG
jgi:hypothetical protein